MLEDAATTGGAVAAVLAGIEALKAYSRRRAARNGNGGSSDCASIGKIATYMERMAAASERSAEASDHIRDSLVELRENQAILLRTIEREVIPKLQE